MLAPLESMIDPVISPVAVWALALQTERKTATVNHNNFRTAILAPWYRPVRTRRGDRLLSPAGVRNYTPEKSNIRTLELGESFAVRPDFLKRVCVLVNYFRCFGSEQR